MADSAEVRGGFPHGCNRLEFAESGTISSCLLPGGEQCWDSGCWHPVPFPRHRHPPGRGDEAQSSLRSTHSISKGRGSARTAAPLRGRAALPRSVSWICWVPSVLQCHLRPSTLLLGCKGVAVLLKFCQKSKRQHTAGVLSQPVPANTQCLRYVEQGPVRGNRDPDFINVAFGLACWNLMHPVLTALTPSPISELHPPVQKKSSFGHD